MTKNIPDNQAQVSIVYDGDCPVCRNYMRFVRLKESVGHVEMVDARQPSPLMAEVTRRGYDIDKGFIVKVNNVFYYGADALHVMSCMSTDATWFNRMACRVFGRKWVSRCCYPVFKVTRNIVLRIAGIPYIRNLDQPSDQP